MKTIFLDAGHGGKDSGAVGNQLKEKDLVLELVLLTREELEKYDCDVVLSRDSDFFVEISNRVTMARKAEADCLLSFHINAAVNTQANGFETFIRADNPTPSIELQKAIHKDLGALWSTNGRNDRGMKQANFGVLRYTPSVLIEFGFISNYLDVELLVDESFKRRQVEAVVKGLVNYFGLKLKKVEVPKVEEKPVINPVIDTGLARKLSLLERFKRKAFKN